jgi:hypothetical protein
MKKLEEFFNNNRESFDDQELPFDHEKRFLKKLNKNKKHIGLKIWYGVAAGFIFLAMLSFFAKGYIFDRSFVKDNSKIMSLSDVSFKYQEVEEYYQAGVDEKIAEFNHLQCDIGKDQKLLIDNELEEFDENYKNLQVELQKNVNDERIINAMINNYETKIRFLELIINQIKQNC